MSRPLSQETKAKISASQLERWGDRETRFWARVNKDARGGCWEWTGAKDRGYGRVWNGQRALQTHLMALHYLGIERPPGLYADHVCRNRACCNPDHLRFVTPAVNGLENNVSPFAINKAKTHCSKGHEYTPENTAVVPVISARGYPATIRNCLTCFPSYAKHPRRIFPEVPTKGNG